MDGDALTRSLQDFLAESPEAVVVEGGEVIFDFTTAKYACRAEHGKCLLHLWSEERNTVRRILDIKVNVSALDSRLDPACVYSQVPAFSASDRAMIDVLALTRERRLAVVELKADEDIHLPLQGLDYWARVEWHRARGEFQKFGYFPGIEIAPTPPLLLLVAPSLRVHPATDALLRYIAPEIECELVGIGEKWREGIQVVFRKRRENLSAADTRG
jgi:hypothetical protein